MEEKINSFLEETITELRKAGKEIDKKSLKKELSQLLGFGVPLEQAKLTLIQRYGSQPTVDKTEAPQMLIRDLKGNEVRVNLLCRVISINEKRTVVDGNERVSYYGIIEDKSAVVGFTAWQNFKIKKGDALLIKNAYTRLWENKVRINLGNYTSVEKTDQAELPESQVQAYKVKDLKAGLRNVEVIGKIIGLQSKEVKVKEETKKLWTGLIGDETGKIEFSAWHDFQLKSGEVIKISGGWISSWKNLIRLSFDERTEVERLPKDMIPSVKVEEIGELTLEELSERGGADVGVKGTIIDIKEGSGLIFRCPECKRVLKNNLCRIHGKVEGLADLRVKAVVDDGTYSITAILGKELTQKLIGKTLEECQAIAQQAMDYKVIEKEIKDKLLAEKVVLKGNAIKDEWGITFIAKDAQILEVDLAEELRKIEEEELT
jgi:replication factor A1